MTDQCNEACKNVMADPHFANGLNIVGISHGGPIGRSIVQMCPSMVVHTVVTIGSPNNGVAQIPNCISGFTC
jgi:triacylglycerol esterase/lipase EstA (alpha/beta hydrolase family)